jgi:hypothetical protein
MPTVLTALAAVLEPIDIPVAPPLTLEAAVGKISWKSVVLRKRAPSQAALPPVLLPLLPPSPGLTLTRQNNCTTCGGYNPTATAVS